MAQKNGAGAAAMTNGDTTGGDERLRALDLAIGQIEKQFGRGAIMRLGEASTRMTIYTLSLHDALPI